MNWVKMTGADDGDSAGRTESEIEQIQHHPFYSSLDGRWNEKEAKRFNVSVSCLFCCSLCIFVLLYSC